jgi:NTP pyrophosphatase (non-canonical NTP hydrolase)
MAVAIERLRQDTKKAEGRFRFTCADDGMTPEEKLTVLAEEFGEVATETSTMIGRRQRRNSIGTPEALYKELVQVAAVAVAWAESLYDAGSDQLELVHNESKAIR